MDPWSPLYKEVLVWGQSTNPIPEQDWDLALIINFSFLDFYRLIADPSITVFARSFFIGCLYTLVGDAVRTEDKDIIKSIKKYSNTSPPDNKYLTLWMERSLALIESPEDYDYVYWGDNPSQFANEGGL